MEFLFRDRGQGKRQVKVSQDIALLEDQFAAESSDDSEFKWEIITFKPWYSVGSRTLDTRIPVILVSIMFTQFFFKFKTFIWFSHHYRVIFK